MAATGNVTWLSPARANSRRIARRTLPSLAAMWRAAATRRMLAGMDDRMLADIGIGRADAATEAARKPWDIGLR